MILPAHAVLVRWAVRGQEAGEDLGVRARGEVIESVASRDCFNALRDREHAGECDSVDVVSESRVPT